MIRTSKRDNNYLSLANGLTNLAGQPGLALPDPLVLQVADPQAWSSLFKVCDGTHDRVFTGVKIPQGQENAVDVSNHVSNLTVVGEFGEVGATGDQVLTVKGGCNQVMFSGTLKSRGRHYDVLLGNWDDESYNVTTDTDLAGLKHADGGAIRVVVGRARWPTKGQLGVNCRVLILWSLGAKLYWWTKWVLVKTVYRWWPKVDPQAGT